METSNRGSFTGKLGFVLAAAGSAVGLGNIWRFPYLAAEYGGGIFLLVYIVLAVTLGFTLMTAEIAIGRKTGLSAIGAYGALNAKFSFLGKLTAVIPAIILPYYSVIGGWVLKYLFIYLSGGGASAAQNGYFRSYIGQPVQPILWFLLFIGITFVVVLLGVEKGVEKCSKIMMPFLVVLSIVIAVYVVCLPGAMDGVIYYLKPDFSKFTPMTVLAAMGQLFYSMSLAMGIMVTYGSYMKKDVNLDHAVRQIEIFDTGIALLAGLMIVPAVYTFSGGNESAMQEGSGLMFITLPKVFSQMPFGSLLGLVFFLLVLFAALTSSISLMETVVSILRDKTGLSRNKAAMLTLGVSILLGLPSSLGFGPLSGIAPLGLSILDFFDFISNAVLMPIVALLTCIFVVWFVGTKSIVEEVKLSSQFKREKMFCVMIKYFAPICIVLILISSILDSLEIVII